MPATGEASRRKKVGDWSRPCACGCGVFTREFGLQLTVRRTQCGDRDLLKPLLHSMSTEKATENTQSSGKREFGRSHILGARAPGRFVLDGHLANLLKNRVLFGCRRSPSLCCLRDEERHYEQQHTHRRRLDSVAWSHRQRCEVSTTARVDVATPLRTRRRVLRLKLKVRGELERRRLVVNLRKCDESMTKELRLELLLTKSWKIEDLCGTSLLTMKTLMRRRRGKTRLRNYGGNWMKRGSHCDWLRKVGAGTRSVISRLGKHRHASRPRAKVWWKCSGLEMKVALLFAAS